MDLLPERRRRGALTAAVALAVAVSAAVLGGASLTSRLDAPAPIHPTSATSTGVVDGDRGGAGHRDDAGTTAGAMVEGVDVGDVAPVDPVLRTPEPGPVGPIRSDEQVDDLYAHTRAGMLSPAVAGDPALVYVPNLADGTVSVIDQVSLQVVRTLPVGREPQHVVPSWDLRTLWVNNNRGDTLSPIDPATGELAGPPVPVVDPYNLYFTPDGATAIVMAEARGEINLYDPHTWALQASIPVAPACAGVNHADFSADGTFLIATCEFSGRLLKLDLVNRRIIGTLALSGGGRAAPQDIKIDPFGAIWYVADMNADGVHEIDGAAFTEVGFLPTGPETHGLYPSRDGRYLYVANRGGTKAQRRPPFAHRGTSGSVSVVDFRTRQVAATWPVSGGGTPDMGNVSADGSRLWLSGRRSGEVYVFDTGGADVTAGHLVARITVGREPHGLAVWPLPGRYSLGHTGILR